MTWGGDYSHAEAYKVKVGFLGIPHFEAYGAV
jgi:hypothetical protein